MEILHLEGAPFPRGRLLATPGAIEALNKANQQPFEFLARHARGDWGELDTHDIEENEFSQAGALREDQNHIDKIIDFEVGPLWQGIVRL